MMPSRIFGAFIWLATGLSLCPLSAMAEDGQIVPPALDAICKKDKMPSGFVPVREFNSGQCPSKTAFDLNAWELDKVRDGIVSCALPDYLNDSPPSIAYRVIRKVVSLQCAQHLDGSPNAFKLGRLRNISASYDPSTDIYTNENVNFRPYCWSHLGSDAKSIKVTFNRPIVYFPDNIWGLKQLVTRDFNTDLCPSIEGQVYNAVVVSFYEGSALRGKNAEFCAIGTWGAVDPLFSDWKLFHSDRCGLTNGLNAITVTFKVID